LLASAVYLKNELQSYEKGVILVNGFIGVKYSVILRTFAAQRIACLSIPILFT